MRQLLICGVLSVGLSSCALFAGDEPEACTPACASDMSCVEGVCQPIRCSSLTECPEALLCFEGRCVPSCDGENPCPSRDCEGALCLGSMACQRGDVRSCESACGEGVERCVDFQWTTCSVGRPAPSDLCGDGEDNDCDGTSEEGCPACEEGEQRGCENDCGVGEQRCEEGAWSPCSVAPPDAAGVCPCEEGSFETCETPCGVGQSLCMGGIFAPCLYEGERCECAPGDVEPCELPCGAGERRCEGGLWTGCQGPEPQEELCFNRLDEDCDGQSDEGCVECEVDPLNQSDFYTSLSNGFQQIPLVSSGTRAWFSWYSGVVAEGYVQGVQLDEGAFVKTERFTLPTWSITDLLSLSGGGVLHVGVESQDRILMSAVGSGGVSSTVTFDPPGTVWDAWVLGDSLTQQVIYRTSALYLQRYDVGQPELRPPPLRLSTRVDHLGHDLARGGGRIFVVYQDASADLDEGRILSLILVSDDGERLLGEGPLLDPRTGEPLLVTSAPSVVFKSNQLLVAYVERREGVDSIKSVALNLDGEVVSGPHLLLTASFQESPKSLQLAASGEHRALVWYEDDPVGEDMTKVKYLTLDEEGRATSDIHLVARGLRRIFPQVTYDLSRRPLISWVQSDLDPEFGGELYSLRLIQIDRAPLCK